MMTAPVCHLSPSPSPILSLLPGSCRPPALQASTLTPVCGLAALAELRLHCGSGWEPRAGTPKGQGGLSKAGAI